MNPLHPRGPSPRRKQHGSRRPKTSWRKNKMMERLRRRREQQKCFTLIELLVVVIIIGLLAAIAIPAFMGQRDKANDAVAKSIVRNAATSVEAAFVDDQAYNSISETD